MSLVDAVGNPVILDREEKEYSAGGLRVKLQATPEDMLQRALAGAQKMAGQQAGMIAMQKTGSQAIAQQEAMEVASKVTDPFAMEPAALAVFLLLAREIEFRDKVIADLASRLDKLDNKKTNLEHPYPSVSIQEPKKKEKKESDKSVN